MKTRVLGMEQNQEVQRQHLRETTQGQQTRENLPILHIIPSTCITPDANIDMDIVRS